MLSNFWELRILQQISCRNARVSLRYISRSGIVCSKVFLDIARLFPKQFFQIYSPACTAWKFPQLHILPNNLEHIMSFAVLVAIFLINTKVEHFLEVYLPSITILKNDFLKFLLKYFKILNMFREKVNLWKTGGSEPGLKSWNRRLNFKKLNINNALINEVKVTSTVGSGTYDILMCFSSTRLWALWRLKMPLPHLSVYASMVPNTK